MKNLLFELLSAQNNDFTDHDLSVLSDWASEQVKNVPNPNWKRAYALIREGSDLLLRRRARSRYIPDDLSPEEISGIAQGLKDVKSGRVKTLKQIQKELAQK